MNIMVEDVNEHAPRFSSDRYDMLLFTPSSDSEYIGADDDEFSSVMQVEAADYDVGRNGEITYSISGGKKKW